MKAFSWQAPEYNHREKSSDWFWVIGILTAAIVITAVILGNVLFGLVIAIGVFSLTMFAAKKPTVVSVDISDRGVTVNKTLYPFKELDAFWIDDGRENDTRLLVRSKKLFMPLIAIPVKHDDLDELKAFLLKHLVEEPFNPGLVETILERIGF